MVAGIKAHRSIANEGLIDSCQAAFAAANAAEDKKALGTLVLDVKKVTSLTDYFVICGATSPAQVRAIVDNVEKTLIRLGYHSLTVEGKAEGRWVLLDFGHIIVHVLHEHDRSFYNLEKFWNHALIVDKTRWLDSNANKMPK